MQTTPGLKGAKVSRIGTPGRGRVLRLGEPLRRFRLFPEALRRP
jgi:hypothetical protein